MYIAWIKLVLASLIILGEGVFAAEGTQRCDSTHAADSIAAHPLCLSALEGGEFPQDPELHMSMPVRPDSGRPDRVTAMRTITSHTSPEHHAFNARAPPVTAN